MFKNVLAVNLTRGIAGDLVTDLVVGKRDFGEISPREIVPYKLSAPGGVIVDRSVSPGRMYVWDSGNSRILGIDLAKCYASGSPCSGDLVIGQPSLNDFGGCNQDSSFSNYPNRIPASASTLCGIPESTHTTLEDKSFSNMYVDASQSGALYVADSRNHRVLKYNSPFTTDNIADEVWGQTDFTGNGCNISGGIGGGWNNPSAPPQPTASSLCFHTIGASGAGVSLDSQGNLWVADGGNNRVLRFPKDISTGVISKTADLVLGQANFTTGGDWSYGSTLNQMKAPVAVRFDDQGKLYVADSNNNRVLLFNPPFTNGMSATGIFGSDYNGGPLGLEIDPQNRGVWTFDTIGWDGRLKLWAFDGVTVIADLPRISNRGGGSIGFDANGALLASAYVYGQDVYHFTPQTNGSYLLDKQLFSPPGGYNLTTSRRLEHAGWVGVGIAGDQLIVSDSRLLFWNGLSSLTNGKLADGYVGTPSFTDIPNPGFSQVKVDGSNRLWAAKGSQIQIYQAPLTTGDLPIKTLTSPLNVLGGGQITFDNNQGLFGLVPSADGNFLWVSQPGSHRVFRIRSPLATPVVDVVLGQTELTGNLCNRGQIPQPNSGTALNASLDMLCYPGALSLDKLGNLYISDHFLESIGNWRLLMYSSNTFPANPDQPIFATNATKEFPRAYGSNSQSHATFEPAFDSTNRMIVGYNPYLGPRFPEYYNNPVSVNPANPSDPAFAIPNGHLQDFYNWAVAATFDPQDNLYMYDANRGQVRIYKNPFNNPLPTSTPNPTPPPAGGPTPSPIPTLSPSPTPLPSTSVAPTTLSIWSSSAVPTVVADADIRPVELGVKFKSDINGYVKGIRYYKGATNTGIHIGTLWKQSGTKLASATFANETVSGWQTVLFSKPVAITAGTIYVASYHTNVGHYAADEQYFATSGVDNGPLHALKNGTNGGNGVYRYRSSVIFPNLTYKSTNYWVDIVFSTTP